MHLLPLEPPGPLWQLSFLFRILSAGSGRVRLLPGDTSVPFSTQTSNPGQADSLDLSIGDGARVHQAIGSYSTSHPVPLSSSPCGPWLCSTGKEAEAKESNRWRAMSKRPWSCVSLDAQGGLGSGVLHGSFPRFSSCVEG